MKLDVLGSSWMKLDKSDSSWLDRLQLSEEAIVCAVLALVYPNMGSSGPCLRGVR